MSRLPARSSWLFLAVTLALAALVALSNASCASDAQPKTSSYFEREIGPILTHSCSRQTTGCHASDPKGNAVGNLDTTSFETLDRRHDLLVTYGPYSAPGLLTKVGGPQTLTVSTLAGPISITTDIRHAAGAGIDITSGGYATLRRWMDGGATKENVGTTSGQRLVPTGDCKHAIPADPLFDPKVDPPNFDEFKQKVQPVLRASCSAASCHGNDVADFQLVCDEDDAHIRWNAYIAAQFVASTPEESELLRRPLDPARGGVFHEGGIVFGDSADQGYQAMLGWAKARGPAAVDITSPDAQPFVFFANRVQPLMVRKGCMFLGCHSPQMFHDMRLRGGSGGQFSSVATRRNYEMSRLMLALESPDPNVSRLIAKNVYPYDVDIDPKGVGVRHRGGALLEDFPSPDREVHHAAPADCDKVDAEAGDLNVIPAYCVFVAWQKKEREAALKKGPAGGGVGAQPLDGFVYVERPPNKDAPQAFDSYQPGAALHLVKATMGADGKVTAGADKDVTAGCGLSSASADVRGPAVSWDGQTIAFAARASAGEPLAIYTMKADGSGCTKHAAIGKHDPSGNGVLEHDFDPTFAPDGRIVFASSRGAIGASKTDYSGPTRTPSSLLPNSNLYVLDADGSIRQMTFLLGAELAPDFMRDGRLVFTTEKRAPGFYQLAGRRMNLDGGDYHPLYAQRKSVGYEQLTEVHELADRSFVGIFSDKGALAGGGALGVVNRSLGPDQDDRDPRDRFYLHSLSMPDGAASGKIGAAGGAYRSPAPLPGRSILVSYAAGADVGTFDGAYELVQLDVATGARTPLIKAAGKALVEAAAIYARPVYPIFGSRLDEVNGATQVQPGAFDAEVHYLDLGLLSSLLFQNTRTGRPIDENAHALGVLESLPPPPDLTSLDAIPASALFTDAYGKMFLRRRRITGGAVAFADDGSLSLRVPGGIPLVLELYDHAGKLLSTQREEMQLYPGERARQAFRREFFDAQCGGCHGSVSSKEIDVHLRPDVLTSASRVAGFTIDPAHDYYFGGDPSKRGTPIAIDPGLGK